MRLSSRGGLPTTEDARQGDESFPALISSFRVSVLWAKRGEMRFSALRPKTPLPLWNWWMASPGFVPAGWPWGSAPAIKTTPRPQKLPTQTSSLPSIETPHGTLITLLPVKPIGAGWVPSGRIRFITPVVFGIASKDPYHVRSGDLKLFHDGHAAGDLWWREVQGHVARHPKIALRVQGDAADANPDPKRFHL